MMRVEWLQSALDDLADIWTRADSPRRKAITVASHDVDHRLGNDPWHAGESRSGSQRVLFAEPLIVFFRIEADGRTVTVLSVREWRRRGP